MRVEGGEVADRYLIVRAGDRLCALRLGCVIETMRPLPVEPFPGMPPFLLGASIIRGQPTPVMDCAALTGAGRGTPGRYVSLRVGAARRAALAVDSVLGVKALSAALLRELPPLLRAAAAEAIAAGDGELLLVLRDGALVPDAAWRGLEAGVAPA